MQPMFKSGDRVLLRVRNGRKERMLVAVFQAMQSRARVIVWVDDPEQMDDDGMRLVDLKSLRPYYNHPPDQQRRAKHALRLYRQGIRMFRLDTPTGRQFCVETVDGDQQIAVGRLAGRKTVRVVPLHSLWPLLVLQGR